MLNSTLVAVKTSELLYPRIDPAKLKGRKEYPDPEPGPYRPWQSRVRTLRLTEDANLPTSARVDLQKEFWDVGIQAVIQATSIELHAEKPEYPGEDWHAQGQLVFQTKLNPFQLHEPTKSGHLKMIIVHLIDPNRRIMSTSMVPFQRRDWWARDIQRKVPVLRRLPVEVFDNIVEVSSCENLSGSPFDDQQMVDNFPISTIDAEKIRAEMMRERKEL
ncbi:MAG: hypothetical protein Q9202_006575 [Teloschistes flavicans]